MEDKESGNNKLLRRRGFGPAALAIFSVVVVVIVVSGVYSLLRLKKGENGVAESRQEISVLGTESAAEMLKEENAVVVTDTVEGNSSIIVNTVRLQKPGYVVIYEQSENNLGEIVGRSDLLSGGEKKLEIIDLDKVTKDGEKYIAVLHLDDGDEKFDNKLDEVLRSEGNLVGMRFSVH